MLNWLCENKVDGVGAPGEQRGPGGASVGTHSLQDEKKAVSAQLRLENGVLSWSELLRLVWGS